MAFESKALKVLGSDYRHSEKKDMLLGGTEQGRNGNSQDYDNIKGGTFPKQTSWGCRIREKIGEKTRSSLGN